MTPSSFFFAQTSVSRRHPALPASAARGLGGSTMSQRAGAGFAGNEQVAA
ncbi:hypothetical protein [Microbacterium sp.]